MPDVPSHRICSKCNVDKPASEFRLDKRFGILEARCKACGAAYAKRYAKTETGRLNKIRNVQRYAKAHPERIQARIDAKKAKPVLLEELPSHRECTQCKQIKPADSFYIDRRFHCLVSVCIDCKAEYRKQYRSTEHGKQKTAELFMKYYNEKQNRKKVLARDAVRKAVYRKKLTKPDSCSQCGKTSSRIESHHYLGYEWEHRFDIIWCCSACHVMLENKLSSFQTSDFP